MREVRVPTRCGLARAAGVDSAHPQPEACPRSGRDLRLVHARRGEELGYIPEAGSPIADETDDLVGSLNASPPFNALAPDRIQEVARATQVERFAAGATILHQGGSPSPALYMIRSGHVEIRENGRLVDQPGVGEVFGELSLLSGAPPTATVVAGDELICLTVGGDVAREVLGTAGGVGFVQSSLRRGVLRSLYAETRSLAATIEGAGNQEAAVAAAREIPDLACVLLDDGADAVKIGHVISSSIDALTGRLLAFAIDDLGEPPVPWAWMALGSEARLEHQARQIRAVIEPDDFVDPAELGPIERLGLKEALPDHREPATGARDPDRRALLILLDDVVQPRAYRSARERYWRVPKKGACRHRLTSRPFLECDQELPRSSQTEGRQR